MYGFSVPCFIWDPTYEFLTASGFRVLRYDLFGRGFSDRPKAPYDIDLFCKQLKELLDKLELEKVNLIGLSMGGPITAFFKARIQTACKNLYWLTLQERVQSRLSRILRAVLTPGFGELALGLFGRAYGKKHCVRFL